MRLGKDLAMTTRVTKSIGTTITVETTIEIGGPILKAEEAIQVAVNEVGAAATVEALKQFDADGEPLMIGGEKWYAKRPKEKYYQTPYGEVLLARYAYQKAGGGKTVCPLEQEARILRNATPRFAKMVAHKLAQTRHWMCSATLKRITAGRSRNFWCRNWGRTPAP
jgi:hypothetical protein